MASLARLAEVAGLKLSYEMRRPKPVLKRAIRHTVEGISGMPGDTGLATTLKILFRHPGMFAAAVKLFLSREKVDGRRAADEILVRLGK